MGPQHPGRPPGTRSVRLAATELREALTLPAAERAARVRAAKEWLLRAADDQGRESDTARSLYFAAPPATSAKTVSTAETLAGIIAEAQVANTLIAAGQALGETGGEARPEALDDAIVALDSTTDFAVQIESALHFSAQPTHSPDLSTATKTFQSRVQETLNTLVTGARDASRTVVDKLAKLDPTAALDALAQLGGPLAKLHDIGVFIKKGFEKLQQAMNSLRELLNADALREVKEKLNALWNHLSDGTLVDSLLAWVFHRQEIDSAVPNALAKTGLAATAVDSATDLLPALEEGFKSKMAWSKALTAVIAGSAGLVLMFGHVAAGPVALVTAGAYLLILTAIVLIGRDYAGRTGLFHEGKGILGVVESLV
jgi:hypothetical protein